MSEPDFSTLPLPFEKGDCPDADERMFQACFTILGQFVENELGRPEKEDEEDSYRGYRLHFEGNNNPKAIDLWLWYKNELPELERAYEQDLAESYSGDIKTVAGVVDFGRVREPKFPYDYPETVKDEKLRELLEIRRALWT